MFDRQVMNSQLHWSLAAVFAATLLFSTQANAVGCSARAWQDFERLLKDAQNAFVRGDAEPIKTLWSHADDVSIFGGRGGHEVGWKRVGPRLTWASKASSNGTHDDEALGKIIGADLALITQIEHISNPKPDRSIASVQSLRVTQIARCEGSAWRLVHRHADPMTEIVPPAR